MLMPSIFGENLLDDFFDYSFGSHKTFDMMNTDIKDTENGYEITMNMPGVKKEDVKAELKDGYLTIQATTDPARMRRIQTEPTSAESVIPVPAAEASM